jgi:hypothetical protein
MCTFPIKWLIKIAQIYLTKAAKQNHVTAQLMLALWHLHCANLQKSLFKNEIKAHEGMCAIPIGGEGRSQAKVAERKKGQGDDSDRGRGSQDDLVDRNKHMGEVTSSSQELQGNDDYDTTRDEQRAEQEEDSDNRATEGPDKRNLLGEYCGDHAFVG